MSKVNLAALKAAAKGDQAVKVSVTKEWLKAVHSELLDLELRRGLDRLTAEQERAIDEGMDETFSQMDKTFSQMDKTFAAMDKMFGKVFGSGRPGRISRIK